MVAVGMGLKMSPSPKAGGLGVSRELLNAYERGLVEHYAFHASDPD